MGSISPDVNDVVANGGQSTYHYDNHVTFEPRKVHVIMIGAGVSGIGAYKLFKDRFKDKPVKLTIYEKNGDVGGTWLENRYPGCSCDVPAHGYTYSWEGNPNWSQAYVGSEELFNYYKGRAKAFGVYEAVHLKHAVSGMTWDSGKGVWKVDVNDLSSNRTFTDEAEVVINAGGFLNKWKWPDIKGLHDFKGKILHSARWDASYDFKDKTIAVIGSGSSAIQIVPSLQPLVKKLISVNRSATWITPEIGATAAESRDTVFTEEQKKHWAENKHDFLKVRKQVEKAINHLYEIHFMGSDVQNKMSTQFAAQMRERLKAKPEVAERLIPKFGVGCRRITPGKGYLEALSADNVEVAFGQVVQATDTGIVLEDGTRFDVDAIICATGFDTSFRPLFPVIGSKGTDLRDTWKEFPISYLSIMAPDTPNYFAVAGPNFTLANGVFIPCLETIFKYFFTVIEKLQTEGIKSFTPKQQAIDDFQEHKDSVMKDMVWTSTCSSWYKNGKVDGKVWGPWPGSSVQFMEVMKTPRWEDYDIEYIRGNRFAFFGNGTTSREATGGDVSWYLSERGYTYEDAPGQDEASFVGNEDI